MLERGLKLVTLNFVSFMHYVATMLVFFVPIDISHKVFDVPQFFAILIGTFALWMWSFITAWVIIKKVEGDDE